jgi:carbon monoxide dehydrogenase subunit G
MAKLEQTLTIDRPVEEVFAFVSEPEKQAQWRSGIEEAELTSEGPIGVGSTFREVERFLGRKIESTSEVTEFEPNSKFAFKSTSGPVSFEATITLEESADGTRLSMVGDAELGGFFRIAEPIVIRMASRQMETDLASLKTLLEAHG